MIFTKCFFIRLTDKILHQLLLQKPHTLPYLNHPNCLAGFCTRVCSSSPSKGPSTLNGTHRPGLKYTTPPENFAKVWGFSTSGCWVKRDTWNIFMKPQQADIPSSERQDPNAPNFLEKWELPEKARSRSSICTISHHDNWPVTYKNQPWWFSVLRIWVPHLGRMGHLGCLLGLLKCNTGVVSVAWYFHPIDSYMWSTVFVPPSKFAVK